MNKITLTVFVTALSFCSCYFGDFKQKEPKVSKKGKVLYMIDRISLVPPDLLKALDSMNGSPLYISERDDHRLDSEGNMIMPEREFRRLSEEIDGSWLMTYVHRKKDRHIHFIVFDLKENNEIEISSGTCKSDIDSKSTIKRFTESNQIIYTDLSSKLNTHRF